MKKEHEPYLRAVALVMLYLTLSLLYLPAQSMAVLQGDLTGQDNIEGLRRVEDTPLVTATTSSDQAEVCNRQFTSCTPMQCTPFAPAVYDCQLPFASGHQDAGAYELGLRQPTGTPAQTTFRYAVDGLPPVFSSFTVSQVGAQLTANYNVRDMAGPGATTCAGLQTIEFLVNGNVVATDQLDGSCAQSGSLAAEVPGLNDMTSMQLIARDAFGQQGESNVINRIMDTVPPVLPSSFSLRRSGMEVTAVSSETPMEVRVTLKFNITDHNFQLAIVDASNLTQDPARKAQYRALAFGPNNNCIKNGDTYECRRTNLVLSPSDPDLRIDIEARDRFNNRATGPAIKPVEIINEQPVVSCMNTGTECEPCEECYITRGLTTLVSQVEAPGGMRGNAFIVDARKVPGQAVSVSPPTCTTEHGIGWTCIHTIIVPPGTTGQQFEVRARPAPFSHDDVFNPFDGQYTKTFTYDVDVPQILTDPSLQGSSCPIGGQTVQVFFQVREIGSVPFASANATGIASTDPEPVECALGSQEDVYDCTVSLQLLSGTTGGDVTIIVEDKAKNQATHVMGFEVCEQDATTTPNFIANIRAALDRPPAIDERIAAVLPFRVAIPLEITLVNGGRNTETTNIVCTTGDPDEDRPDTVDYQHPPELVRDHTRHPTLELYYKSTEWPENEIQTECTLTFKVRRGYTVFEIPEEETIRFTLPLAGRTLQNPAEAFEESQERLREEIRDLQGDIDKWAKWDDKLSSICGFVGTLVQTNAAIQLVRTVLMAISLVFTGWLEPVGRALFNVAVQLGCNFNKLTQTVGLTSDSNGVLQVLDSAGTSGNLLSFIIAPSISRFMKILCGTYSCHWYKSSTYVELGMNIGAARGWMGEGAQNEGEWTGESPETVRFETTDVQAGSGANPNSVATASMVTTPQGAVTVVTSNPVHAQQMRDRGMIVEATDWDGVTDDQRAKNQQWAEGAYGSDWLIDPYRSARFDAFCLPAHLYNLRKQQQIKCIQHECRESVIEASTNTGIGLSTATCDRQARVLQCLYVEGAMGGLGDMTFWEMLLQGMIMIGWGVLVGWAVNKVQNTMCGQELEYMGRYMAPDPGITCEKGQGCECYSDAWDNKPKLTSALFCGLFTSWQQFTQYDQIMQNPYETASDPGTDFCSGVEGAQ